LLLVLVVLVQLVQVLLDQTVEIVTLSIHLQLLVMVVLAVV
jgi:hypothetical protein